MIGEKFYIEDTTHNKYSNFVCIKIVKQQSG